MININLLPTEYRKRERTPLKIFLPVIGGLVVVLSAGAVAALVHFGRLTETVNDRQMWESRLREKQPQLRHEVALLAEAAEYKKRADTITKIATSRMLMTKKLDLLTDVLVAGRENDEYMIWLNEFKVSPGKAQTRRRGAKGPVQGGQITMRGFALADRDPLQRVNNANGALKASSIFQEEFISLSRPHGKIHEFNDDKSPSRGWTFDQVLIMADPNEVAARRKLVVKTKSSGKSKK